MNVRLLEPAERGGRILQRPKVDGLGDAFLLEALQVFSLVKQYPLAWHSLGGGIRRCRLSRFPYGVIYSPEPDEILIIALAHMHRRPGYWRDRLATKL